MLRYSPVLHSAIPMEFCVSMQLPMRKLALDPSTPQANCNNFTPDPRLVEYDSTCPAPSIRCSETFNLGNLLFPTANPQWELRL